MAKIPVIREELEILQNPLSDIRAVQSIKEVASYRDTRNWNGLWYEY